MARRPILELEFLVAYCAAYLEYVTESLAMWPECESVMTSTPLESSDLCHSEGRLGAIDNCQQPNRRIGAEVPAFLKFCLESLIDP